MDLPRYPSLFQVNTRVRLSRARRAASAGAATLDDMPDAELDALAEHGFDIVWLLGVWQTGEAARAGLRIQSGVAGGVPARAARLSRRRTSSARRSPCATTTSTLTSAATRRSARLRARLRRARAAPDARLRPESRGAGPSMGQRASRLLRRRHRRRSCASSRTTGAASRPPQASASWLTAAIRISPAGPTRSSSTTAIPALQDGDARRAASASPRSATASAATWPCSCCPTCSGARGASTRSRSGRAPRAAVREGAPPAFLFMAEVYWDLEWVLQQQGFDYTYDKRLYDRLREGHARPVREHLYAGLDFQDHLARFLENHDEPRAAATFGLDDASCRGRDHVLRTRPALHSSGPARGAQGAHPDAHRPRSGRRHRLLSWPLFYDRLLAASTSPRFATESGSCSTRGRPGTATDRTTTSSATPGPVLPTSGAWSRSTTPDIRASATWACRGRI